MNPKERVMCILQKKKPDFIPFTIYSNHLPRTTWERELRNEGICLVERTSVFKVETPDIKIKRVLYSKESIEYEEVIYETPFGELNQVRRESNNTFWTQSHIFKSPEDYKKILFLIQNTKYIPCYDDFIKEEKDLGDDFILRSSISANPLHEIMINTMGIEKFSIEWADRRDEIEKLYKAKVKKLRELYPIIAESPCFHFNFGGNETGNVMGRERFEKYVLPLYFECAEFLHKRNKLLGTHLDGNNKVWADLIAKSPLDYIEAFSPFPDTDFTIEEAFNLWKDKILWINFPSSLQVYSEERIEQTVYDFIELSKPTYNLIIGITEDIIKSEEQKVLKTIMKATKNRSI